MIDPVTMTALVKGGGALVKWGANKLFNKQNRQSFESTPYAKRLQQIMSQGRLSTGEETRMVSAVGRRAGNVAAGAAAGYRGRLASMGMLDSVAGARGIADIQMKPMDAITTEQQRINSSEMQAKDQAKDQFAQAKTNYQQQIDEMNQTQNKELVGGLLDAAGSYVGGKITKNLYKDLDLSKPETVQEFLRKGGNVEDLYKMQMGQYYNEGGKTGAGNKSFDINKYVDQSRNQAALDAVVKYKSDNNAQALFDALDGLGMKPEEIQVFLRQLDN
jgi:hypothetical protein